MKALHILYSGLGGSSSVVFSLVKENQKNFLIKQDILFTGPYLFSEYKNKIKTKKNYFFIKTIKFFSWISWLNVFLFLCNNKPDIILLHNFQFIPTLLYKIIFKKKIIYINHQSQNFLIIKSFINIVISCLFFDCIIFVNKKKSLDFKKRFHFFKDKIYHVPNSVDVNFFNNNNNVVDKKSIIIGMAARLDSGKRHELIIKALNHPKLKLLNLTFYIAGEGDNKNYLKHLINQEGLNKKVLFNGSLNKKKMKSWYKKLNLYVHATNGEGMSISILEAMSMKIPVMGSNVMGVNNLLNENKYIGMLFKNSVEDLATKIKYFYMFSRTKKIMFAKKQRKFVLNSYSSTIMFNNYKKIILKFIKD